MHRTWSNYSGIAMLAAVGTAVGAVLYNSFDAISHLELDLYQSSQHLLKPLEPSDRILLIEADDKTPRALDPGTESNTIARAFQAEMVARLRQAGARVVVLDFSFSPRPGSPTPREVQHDRKLKMALADAAPLRVVVAALTAKEKIGDQWNVFFEIPDIVPQPLPAHVSVGHPESRNFEGVIRSVWLFMEDPETKVTFPSVALEAFRHWRGIEQKDVDLDPAEDRLFVGPDEFQMTPDNDLFIRWTRRPHLFVTKPYVDALRQLREGRSLGAYRDKIVMVGRIDEDTHETPIGDLSGIEIHAHMLNTLIAESANPIGVWSDRANIVWTYLLSALAVFSLRKRLPYSLFGAVLVLAAAILVPAVALVETNQWIQTVVALCGIFCTVLASLAYEAWSAKRFEPAALRSGSPHVSDAAVLFVDLVGSTEFVATVDPTAGRKELDAALAHMAEVIDRHQGDVEKTMGDGIMAVFRKGTPQERVRHAASAAQELCRSASDGRSQSRSWEIRAGIEFGPIAGGVLRAGRHAEWSSHGTTIHLASRLQAKAGELRERTLLGPAAAALVSEEVGLKDLGEGELKGFGHKVRMYALEANEANGP